MSTTLKYIKLSDLLEKYSTHIELIKNKYLNLLSELTEVTDLSSEIFINNINAIHKMGTIIICYKETPLSDKFDIVGSGTIIIEPKLIHGGKSVGHIEDIVTNCNYRGKGVAKDILDLDVKSRILDLEKQRFAKEANRTTGEEGKLNRAIAESLEEQVKEIQNLKKELEGIIDASDKISKNFGVKTFGALSDITTKLPGLRKFSEPFQQASEAARSTASNIEMAAKSGGKGLTAEKIKQLGLEKQVGNLTGAAAAAKLKGMSGFSKGLISAQAGFKALGPMIKTALGPVVLIVELIKGITQADKETTELQKSMALSKKG
jgi:glucosamine-phosphate N-acetyltransferase